jgi:hypothetical protein
VDLLYGIADAIYSFMESGPPMPAAFLYIAVGSVPVTLLPELGHAFAARRVLGSEVEVSVGNAGKIAQVRLGQIDATINVASHPGRAAGIATFEASRATAEQVLWIALAGPLASLAGVVLAAAALRRSRDRHRPGPPVGRRPRRGLRNPEHHPVRVRGTP